MRQIQTNLTPNIPLKKEQNYTRKTANENHTLRLGKQNNELVVDLLTHPYNNVVVDVVTKNKNTTMTIKHIVIDKEHLEDVDSNKAGYFDRESARTWL